MKKGKGNKNILTQLSKAVKNKNNSHLIHPNAISKHVVDIREDKNAGKTLKSKIETKNLDEYLELAKLANKKYEVLNEQVVIQTLSTNNVTEFSQNKFSQILVNNVLKNTAIKANETKQLMIPKRPKWKEGISVKEFERMEREAFLNWRRSVAEEEEKNMNFAITPFEKNIEVWRQLWLVVEKCQILIQIVDGRNPMYFRCPDLENYIKDVGIDKHSLLLVNKADLMTESVRKIWADFFIEKGIQYVFFSALEEAIKVEEEIEKIEQLNKSDSEDDEEDEELEESVDDNDEQNKEEVVTVTEIVEEMKLEEKIIDPKTQIYDRTQLIGLIRSLISKNKSTTSHVGFIGYPNVGKSSVINVLMKKKRVGVAQMPGKTKHYQTLFLPEENKDICLMDCPGLVFPSFTSSKADMVVNGVLPIDTMREYHTPIALVIQNIPRKILERFYKVELPDIYSATQFLQVLATKRGFITGRSLPDEAKISRLVLKDYVSGKIIHCALRPDYKPELHGKAYTYDETYEEELNQEEQERHDLLKDIPADFDDDYDKINIDVDTNRNLTTLKENFDSAYFNHIMDAEDAHEMNKNEKINKDMKRALKFALKRGDITEEEYENTFTYEDYRNILIRIQKKEDGNKKNLVGVKVISVDK